MDVYSRRIELPGPRWPHDLGMTENYCVLHDLPLFFDPERLLVVAVHHAVVHVGRGSKYSLFLALAVPTRRCS
ncbi:hypothetical protein A2G96_09365 [Cupriavidus nantongensis]|uniref:Uncharacterized protein n=1 Tax=Cupriavidus nantongensis TaxID=1796606 RepID=A0A142JIL9_9BURK|nr:hypothetical protein A2G96_09365 [Cupriavidus nantongensis]